MQSDGALSSLPEKFTWGFAAFPPFF